MINNVFVKRKSKRRKSNINEHDDSWIVISCDGLSGKCESVGMINNLH